MPSPISPAILAWLRLVHVYTRITHHTADAAKPLTLARFDVLNHAGLDEGRTQQHLADALLVTKGNVCQLLDGMEADGLLYRRRKGRTNHIFLTDAGRALRAESLAAVTTEIESAFAALSPEDTQALATILGKLDRAIAAHDTP